jgi:hypothetical protein
LHCFALLADFGGNKLGEKEGVEDFGHGFIRSGKCYVISFWR